ncbi:helix-turn-helix domain-containing protein [Streptomyces sp. NBC_01142]|uniref:ArsR/SmtB family transcription factor n=1 Tax=Streptomyces sp. NBC_01142 TaxID=2975865 RepID=UPI002250211E|nr:helix-turn-helix domain-containing protein [Streptomyces sp. NBC_01142]MCX4824150.1 helix-turn-helix domain-containing protein [Streptomyces sp. NBC_01142]
MDLEERVAELERRLAALESAGTAEGTPKAPSAPQLGDGRFWALEGLKEQLAEAEAPDGGVLFTGAVRLPTQEHYEWQYGALTEGLLEADWAETAESFTALGHEVRLRLLREILGGRRTAAELTELEGLGTTGQIYHHLRLLTGAGWLHTPSRGRYEVPGTRVVPLLVVLTAARP